MKLAKRSVSVDSLYVVFGRHLRTGSVFRVYTNTSLLRGNILMIRLIGHAGSCRENYGRNGSPVSLGAYGGYIIVGLRSYNRE